MSKKNVKKYKHLGGKENEIIIEEPTLASNLEKTAAIGIQAANNQASMLLNSLANSLNVDPNAGAEIIVTQLNDRFQQINDALQTPEGKQMLAELGQLASKLIATLEQPIKQSQHIFYEMMMEQLRNFEKVAWGAIGLVPVVGDVSELIRIAKDLFHAFTKSMKSVTGIAVISSSLLENVSNTINQQSNLFMRMAKLVQGTLEKGNRAIDKGSEILSEGNKGVNDLLTMASDGLKEQSKYINQKEKEMSEKVNFQKMIKGGAKITKRANNSIQKFLSTKITSSQIKKKYSVKRRPQKNSN